MEAEDVIPLPASDSESDREEAINLSHEAGESIRDENQRESLDDTEVEEGQLVSVTAVVEHVADASYLPEEVGLTDADDTNIVKEAATSVGTSYMNDTEVEEGQLVEMDTDGNAGISFPLLHESFDLDTHVSKREDNMPLGCVTESERPATDGASISGVKRTRAAFEEDQQPSVHVKFYGLSRHSKQKLEELLREWSEWHAQNSSLTQDENGVLDFGEEIYFPALDIGTGKTSAVTFWMENEIRKPEDKDFIPVEDASVPYYDRGFSLGLTSADGSSNLEGRSELLDAPRCFNCSSYNHSLKECPKPRDNDAVNNSRKQHKSKRNQTAGSRNPTRYYQDSPGGKYEGLRPGDLHDETRRLLGLGESDPPPWLNRMREIGYPPGYLEPEDKDCPSGITIFAGDELKEETEDGEILGGEIAEVSKKMSVKFPGINAPIPKNADERVWAARPSKSDRHRNGDSNRSNYSSESNRRGRFRELNNRDFREEDPLSDDRASKYASRYDDYDFSPSARSWREDSSVARSSSYGRSVGDRGRNDSDGSSGYHLYSSFSYDSSRRFPEPNDSLGHQAERISRSRDRDDRHRHCNGR